MKYFILVFHNEFWLFLFFIWLHHFYILYIYIFIFTSISSGLVVYKSVSSLYFSFLSFLDTLFSNNFFIYCYHICVTILQQHDSPLNFMPLSFYWLLALWIVSIIRSGVIFIDKQFITMCCLFYFTYIFMLL